MNKSSRALFIIVTALLIVFVLTTVRLVSINKSLRNSLPYLLLNESIGGFELVNEQGERATVRKSEKPAFILVFSRPCSPCDQNIGLWNAFAEMFSEKMDFYGIVLDEAGAMGYLREKSKLDFPLYVPTDIKKFISSFRLRLPHSQTIIVSPEGKVAYLKPGELTQDDFSKIVEQCEKY
ncbi:MAG TPA: redoxin domain-containing protein [Deltaproteobacteria bacterium]|nr:redoxin domain-containing protein [Deltaproteobacteria bacterium]